MQNNKLIDLIKKNIAPLNLDFLTREDNIAQYNLLLTTLTYLRTKNNSEIKMDSNFNTTYLTNEEGNIFNLYSNSIELKINGFPTLTFNINQNVLASPLGKENAKLFAEMLKDSDNQKILREISTIFYGNLVHFLRFSL